MSEGTVYLLHFDRKLCHAQHYLGFAEDLEARLSRHRAGNGARLVAAFMAEGIDFVLARTWQGDRNLERKLKRRKNASHLCPICRRNREKQ